MVGRDGRGRGRGVGSRTSEGRKREEGSPLDTSLLNTVTQARVLYFPLQEVLTFTHCGEAASSHRKL